MAVNVDTPLGCELILHGAPPSHLRMSASVKYSAEGELESCGLRRDDDRGPWPSAGWSASRDARVVSSKELAAVLARYDGATGEGDAISATLEPESLQAVPFGACRAASTMDEDVILLCADVRKRNVHPQAAHPNPTVSLSLGLSLTPTRIRWRSSHRSACPPHPSSSALCGRTKPAPQVPTPERAARA